MTALSRLRKPMIVLASVTALAYLTYRIAFTLNLTSPYAVFASLFLLAGESFGVVSLLLYFLQVWDVKEPPQQPVLPGRTVDVLVPTYNEDVQLLRGTLQACLRMDYPHRTFVLDDGRRPEVEALAKELGVHYVSRADNRHAKAGNLNNALEQTDGEFVIIFDADHVPEPHFITRLLGYFRDEKLAFVQTPHAFYNFDSFQAQFNQRKRVYWEEGQLFYDVIQPGRNRWNCPIFAGSAAMFRRKALKEAGYIAVETITEDMHTGMRMNARGWKSMAISERLIAGQAATDVTTFHSQRLRWGSGNLSILRFDNPLTMRGLTLAQRLCHFGSMIHWLGGAFKLCLYLTPLLMLFTGVPPVAEFTWTLGLLTLTYLLVTWYATRVAGNGLASFRNSELFSMMSFWTTTRAAVRALLRPGRQKFVVTSKRGRQSKSIWPFIRPQAVLIGLTALALVWAWGRVGLGLTTDYFKPGLATFWGLFHATLAFIVIRRALAPEDGRFNYRHAAHLPAAYALRDGEKAGDRRLGMILDLNESGAALVTYRRLTADDSIDLEVLAGGERVQCRGRVRWVKELTRQAADESAAPTGYRCGVVFEGLAPEQTDSLHRLCLHYTVPRRYLEFAVRRLAARFRSQRSEKRLTFRLPLMVGTGDSVQYAVTDDLARNSVGALLDAPLAVGSEHDLLLTTPLGEVSGKARVLRHEPRKLAGRTYHHCVFQFSSFAAQSRGVLLALVSPAEHRPLRPVLEPTRQTRPLPLFRPVMVAALFLAPLVAAEGYGFWYYHRDDLFLRDVALSGTADAAAASRVERLCTDGLQARYPDLDRLVLVRNALQRLNRPERVAQLTVALAEQNPNDLGLRAAEVYALADAHDYDRADVAYRRLEQDAHFSSIPEAEKRKILLAATRSCVQSGKLDAAAERFDRLLQQSPTDMALRNEYAGVLIAAHRFPDAIGLYAQVAPDPDGLFLLATAHEMGGDVEQAEKECRQLLRSQPGEGRGELLLAKIADDRRDPSQARAILAKVIDQTPGDVQAQFRLGQLALKQRNYDEALQIVQKLPSSALKRLEIAKAFIDAAASAEGFSEEQRPSALALYDDPPAGLDQDAVYLARLGWALQKLNEPDKSVALLDKAVALAPQDQAVRRQLLTTLTSAGRWKDALQLAEGSDGDFDVQYIRAGLRLKEDKVDLAEQDCRRMLEERPDDKRVQLLLADVLGARKDFRAALAVLDALVKDDPTDGELAMRQAQATLWAGDYALAMQRFESQLGQYFDRPDVWRGYIDAAASAETLTAAQGKLAVQIADALKNHPTKEAAMLCRLAWVLQRGKETERATALLDRVSALHPQEPAVLKEYAGALASVGKSKQALQIYKGLTLEPEDRLRLAMIYCAENQFEPAEKECRAVLELRPGDRKGRRVLADVLSWRKEYTESLTLLQQLAQETPSDDELAARLAEVTLWSGDAAGALPQYEKLLEKAFDQPTLWRGYVDAAAGAETVTEAQGKLAERIAEAADSQLSQDATFTARLAWVLLQSGDKTRGGALLSQALAMNPKAPAARKELAGALAAAGKTKQALQMYEGLQLDDQDRIRLAQIHAAEKEFDKAETLCRAVVAAHPDWTKARVLLADVTCWEGRHKEAAALYGELLEADPDNSALRGKLAEATLWGGDYDAALDQMTRLAGKAALPAPLQDDFIDAAAGARTIDDASKQVLLDIADGFAARKAADPVYLGRLGWVFSRVKEVDRSVAVLKKALDLDPTQQAVRLQLADALYAAGKFAEAEEQYQQVLRKTTPAARPAAGKAVADLVPSAH